MDGSQTWVLAGPILLSLGAWLALHLLGGLVLRRRRARELARLPFTFFSASLCIWVFFRTVEGPAHRYAVAVALAALISGVIHLGSNLFFTTVFSRRREIRFPPLLRNVVLGLADVVVLLLCVKALNRSFLLTPFLVTSGVLSLIVGLALQDILGNFFAGVVLTIEKPFRIDDWIDTGEYGGQVVEVTWRTTKIRTRDNDYLVIPNRRIAAAALTNRCLPTVLHRRRVQVGLPYATLPSLADEALVEAAGRVDGVRGKPPPEVYMLDFADSGMTYELAFWVDNPDRAHVITSNVRREIFYALKRYGISVPFPVRDVHVRRAGEPAQVWKEGYRFRVEVIDGPVKGLVFPVHGAEVLIGRAEGCAIELREPSISKHHARLTLADGGYLIEDLESRHGTLLNGRPADGQRVRTGDEITVGSSVLRVEEVVST